MRDLNTPIYRTIGDPPEYEEACEICGKPPDDCTCPICPVCHVQGDPKCILEHGLVIGLPCYRFRDEQGWFCLHGYMGCLYNDGHDNCAHPGDSASPLEDAE